MHTIDAPGLADADAAALAEVVSELRAAEAAVAAAQAARVRVLARAGRLAAEQATSRRAREVTIRSIAAELACALRVSDRTVQAGMNDALTLAEQFPGTLAAWEAGRIGQGHVRAIVDTGAPLDVDLRAEFEAAALSRCEAETPGRARPALQALAERLQPRSLGERHERARRDRAVRVVTLTEGMGELVATLPLVLAHGIHDRLTRQARIVKDAEAREGGAAASGGAATDGALAETIASDRRSMDQLRADILADILLTGRPEIDPTGIDGAGELGAVRAHVQVTIPALTLLGADAGEPAMLAGRSPLDPRTARRLAGGHAGFDRVLTDPVTGSVLAVDRYRPSKELQRFLRARDQHCRFPGCRVPAIRADLDHTRDAAHGGETSAENLAHLCRRHHVLKHASPWRVRQRTRGTLEWTSPLGHVYTDHAPVVGIPPDAPPGVRFTPDPLPDRVSSGPASRSEEPAPF